MIKLNNEEYVILKNKLSSIKIQINEINNDLLTLKKSINNSLLIDNEPITKKDINETIENNNQTIELINNI